MHIRTIISTLTLAFIFFAGCTSTKVSPQSNSMSVEGTVWIGKNSYGDDYTFFFLPRGALHYKSPTGFWKKATWKQKRNTIYMETNNKYAEYKGTIQNNVMRGKAWNIKGRQLDIVCKKVIYPTKSIM